MYGQRHVVELEAAQRVASAMGVDEHVVHSLDLRVFGASALTSEIDVPKDAVGAPGIPVTYVPARNTIFLSLALGYAEAREAQEIWIGVNEVDSSGYPDCRPEFIDAFQQVIRQGHAQRRRARRAAARRAAAAPDSRRRSSAGAWSSASITR